MAKKKKLTTPENPFISHTVEQIAYAEATSYVIQVGIDLYENKGHMTFSRKTAESHYVKVLGALLHTIANGDEEDKSVALKCLMTLKILPLRVQ